MKLGISSLTYNWAVGIEGHRPERCMSFMDLIEKTKDFGLSLLQIGDNMPLDRMPEEELRIAREALRLYGIELELGCRGLLDPVITRYLELCCFFSAKLLRIVIDLDDFRPDEDEIIRILKKWAPAFEQEKVVLAIENHDRLRVSRLVHILQEVDSKYVRICLDTANSIGCLEGVDTVLDALIPYTANLHAKDVSVQRLPSQLGFQVFGYVSGEGMLDVPAILQQVYLSDERVNCILEQWTPFRGSIEETIEAEKAAADKGVMNLKRLIRETTASNRPYQVNRVIRSPGSCMSLEEAECGGTFYQAVISGKSPDMAQLTEFLETNREFEVSAFCIRDMIDDSMFEAGGVRKAGISHLISVLKECGAAGRVIFSLGKKRAFDGGYTLKNYSEAEQTYYSNLADLINICKEQGMGVCLHLRKDGFIDDISAFARRMNHYGCGICPLYF